MDNVSLNVVSRPRPKPQDKKLPLRSAGNTEGILQSYTEQVFLNF